MNGKRLWVAAWCLMMAAGVAGAGDGGFGGISADTLKQAGEQASKLGAHKEEAAKVMQEQGVAAEKKGDEMSAKGDTKKGAKVKKAGGLVKRGGEKLQGK